MPPQEPAQEAADPITIAATLAERHGYEAKNLAVEIYEGQPLGMGLKLRNKEKMYCIDVFLLQGGIDKEASILRVADALDSLIGMLIESDYSHRELPHGDDISFAGGQFRVLIEMQVPSLDAWANQILSEE